MLRVVRTVPCIGLSVSLHGVSQTRARDLFAQMAVDGEAERRRMFNMHVQIHGCAVTKVTTSSVQPVLYLDHHKVDHDHVHVCVHLRGRRRDICPVSSAL